ncbi:recombinase family protein [Pseudomonas sp. R5(2019)]|uniref:recombinase family protein n=1 Tax=Pseudomonas sp. R5(2019) TaxID=2697566 RepID=UPI0014135098|nr:recombinase family protein [Pseudomonas sp. R5(2019)]NBA96845.1 recombinase family protein [Pseudomonas sp. R5(2019)]
MPTAFSYARFSSIRQQRGSSLERQQTMVASWLVQHPEYSLSDTTFQDLGKSGWKGEHIKEGGDFAKLLAAVEAGVIKKGDAVLVEAIDRTGRLPVLEMLSSIVSPILRAGVSIITLEDNVAFTEVSLNEGGHIYILVGKIQAARQYSDNLSRRLTASYDSRRKLAKEGKTPKRNTPVWLTSKGDVVQQIADQVKLAFELYTSGLGKAVIAKRMRESGVEALAKCSGPGVEGWLRNEAVIGRWNGSQVYEPIIDLSLYHLAQIEGNKRKTAPRAKTAAHFYVGLVKCGSCGHNFIMRTIKGVQVSMRCRRRQELKGCDNKKVIPKTVIDAVYEHTSKPASHRVVARERSGVNEKAIIAAEAKILELSKEIEAMLAAFRASMTIPEVANQIQAMHGEREAAERELTLLKATVERPPTMWRVQGRVEDLERSDPQRLAAMLRSVGYTITIYSDGRLISSEIGGVYRYAGVNRREDKYKLMRGGNELLVSKVNYVDEGEDWMYWEPKGEGSETEWDVEDSEAMRSRYE